MIKDPAPTHDLVKRSYKHISLAKDGNITCRKDAALVAQLRSGHCKYLAAYEHRIDPTKSPICKKCDEEEETVQHWLKCPATIQKRISIFGQADISLGTLTKDPTKVLTFARATLLEGSP